MIPDTNYHLKAVTDLHAHELEELVATRTAELRELVDHLETVREKEKHELARELHDDLGSSLTALAMRLAIISRQSSQDAFLMEHWQKANTLLTTVTQTTRRIQSGLRPSSLDALGIHAAISEHIHEFQQQSGIVCKLVLPDSEPSIDRQHAVSLFRMLQEALKNIVSHAKSANMDVTVDYDDSMITLAVSDDGIGFDSHPDRLRDTHGLRKMQERARYLGGTLAIDSKPGQGTRLKINVPKSARKAAEHKV
ncbi:MAG: sensor histidine kinase [Herminiimonas sp.]|nr:sensor histidine kinase [Herminiimonas sp.]